MATWSRSTVLMALVGAAAVFAVPVSVVQAEVIDREKAASEVAATFLNESGTAMTREMTKGGPAEAIKVCLMV